MTRALAESLTGSDDCEAAVGRTFLFMGKELTVAGVNRKADADFNTFFRVDIYYRQRMPAQALFIPYETIRTMGEPVPLTMFPPYVL